MRQIRCLSSFFSTWARHGVQKILWSLGIAIYLLLFMIARLQHWTPLDKSACWASNLLGFVTKAMEPEQWTYAPLSDQLVLHRLRMHGTSNRDTHLHLPHDNSSVHLTISTYVRRGLPMECEVVGEQHETPYLHSRNRHPFVRNGLTMTLPRNSILLLSHNLELGP